MPHDRGYNLERLKKTAFRKGQRDGHLRTITASYSRQVLRDCYSAGYRKGAKQRDAEHLALVQGDTFRRDRGATLEEMSWLEWAKVGGRYLVGFPGSRKEEAVANFATSGEATAFIHGAKTD